MVSRLSALLKSGSKLANTSKHKLSQAFCIGLFLLSHVALTHANNAPIDIELNLQKAKLSDTILSLSKRYNISILAPSNLLKNKVAPALQGIFTLQEALDLALKNSQLKAYSNSKGLMVIKEELLSTPSQNNENKNVNHKKTERIIVFGSKQNLGVQDTSISAEIFSKERIEQEALYRVQDIFERTPNVFSSNGTALGITIRGVGRNGATNSGQGEAINIYVDGAPISSLALQGPVSIWDVEQVEVLRGPQSTIQGRNALAGAVILKTADPSFDWTGKTRIRAANAGTRQYSGAISGPIITDELAFRLSADHQETDGFVKNAFSGKNTDAQDRDFVRGKLLWQPKFIEGLTVNMAMEQSNSDGHSRDSVTAPVEVNNSEFINFNPRGDILFDSETLLEIETSRIITDVEYKLSDHFTWRVVGTYEDSEVDSSNRLSDDNGFTEEKFNFVQNVVTQSLETRVEFDFGKLTGLVGLYYFDSEDDRDQDTQAFLSRQVPFFPVDPQDTLLTLSQFIQREVENTSLFTSVRYQPSKNWTLDFGLRLDNEKYTSQGGFSGLTLSSDACMITLPGAVVGAPLPFVTIPCLAAADALTPSDEPRENDDFDVVLPRGSITYHVNKDLSFFAGARKGYRAGGTNSAQNPETGLSEVTNFDPEFLISYEAGWRSQWLNGDLTVNGTVFRSEYEDQQVRVLDPSGQIAAAIVVNAAESTLQGIELTTQYNVSKTLALYLNLGVLDSNFDDFPFSEPGTEEINLGGNKFANSPETSLNFGINYNHSNGVFANVSFTYQGEGKSSVFNFDSSDLGTGFTENLDPITSTNLSAGYEAAAWKISLLVSNLFDNDDFTDINIANRNLVFGGDLFRDQPRFTLQARRTASIAFEYAF